MKLNIYTAGGMLPVNVLEKRKIGQFHFFLHMKRRGRYYVTEYRTGYFFVGPEPTREAAWERIEWIFKKFRPAQIRWRINKAVKETGEANPEPKEE